MEKEIELEKETIKVYAGGGAVDSVNGKTGDVVLTTSDLENDSDYQTGSEVESAISTAIADKQDTLTAGANISISDQNVISATDTTYTAGNGLSLNSGEFSADTQVLATKSSLEDEVTARQNADNGLQGQIDALSASSDVTDIVGTKAELNAYDTSQLKDNDIVKVLQDESQNDETTYYRWSTTTHTFTLIGEEGPYYTKSATDTLLNAKQNTLTAGSNISITEDTISATDTTYSAFTGTDGASAGTSGLVPAPATTDAGKFLKADGTWDTAGGGSGPTVVQTTGTSTTDVMSQNAVTGMVFKDGSNMRKIAIGNYASASSNGGVAIGGGNTSENAAHTNSFDCVAIGRGAASTGTGAVTVGPGSKVLAEYAIAFGAYSSVETGSKGSIALGPGTQVPGSKPGVIQIGVNSPDFSNPTNYGYNNTIYKLVSGVYDGQGDHDAVTVGQVNSVIDAINTALSTNILHIGA